MKISSIVIAIFFSLASFATPVEQIPEIAEELKEKIIELPTTMEKQRNDMVTKTDQLNLSNQLNQQTKSALYRKSFPTVKIETWEQADQYYEEYFEGYFFWWSCEDDLVGKEFNAAVFEVAKNVSSVNQLWAQQTLMISNGKYIDSAVFLFLYIHGFNCLSS